MNNLLGLIPSLPDDRGDEIKEISGLLDLIHAGVKPQTPTPDPLSPTAAEITRAKYAEAKAQAATLLRMRLAELKQHGPGDVLIDGDPELGAAKVEHAMKWIEEWLEKNDHPSATRYVGRG